MKMRLKNHGGIPAEHDFSPKRLIEMFGIVEVMNKCFYDPSYKPIFLPSILPLWHEKIHTPASLTAHS